MTLDIVIGVGNTMRRDDGVGPAAIALLAQSPDITPDIELTVLDGESTRLLEAWRGRTLAIVVDATRTGDPPGTIHRVDIATDPVPVAATTSSHGAGVAQAVALARTLDALPDRLIVYGVEPGDLAMGEGLSPAVAAALPELVDRIEAELARH